MTPPDAGKLLSKALALVSNEITQLEAVSKNGKLGRQGAQDLVRYASLLNDISNQDQEDAKKAKKQLQKMTTEELIEKYKQINSKGRDEKPKGTKG